MDFSPITLRPFRRFRPFSLAPSRITFHSLGFVRVVVLASSEDIRDLNRAYEMGANSFLVKPHDFTDFTAMMRTLSSFWFKCGQSPGFDLTYRPRASNAATAQN